MNEVLEQGVHCPYCNERIGLLIDPSTERQDYIEDCQVCCRPIRIQARINGAGAISVNALAEND